MPRESLEERADAYALLGQYEKAILDLNDATAMNQTTDPQASKYYRDSTKLKLDAIKDWDARIRKSPRRPENYCGQAICRAWLRRYKEAVTDASAALALNAKLVEAYQIRSLSYAQEKDLALAVADIDKAVNLAPTAATNYILMPQLYINCRRAEQGLEDLKRRLSQDANNTNLLLAHAELANYLKNNAMALADVSKAISIEPTLTRALYARAGIYQELGKPAQAADDYTQCVKLDPSSVKPYKLRAACYVEMGQFEKARQDLTKLINKHEYCQWYRARSQCYEKLGKSDLARQDRQRAAYLESFRSPVAAVLGD